MNLRLIIIAIQCFCILGLFVEGWIVFRRIKTPLHAYLLLSSVAAFVNNLGYLLELESTTREGYISALKFSYLGREFYAFFIVLFCADMVRIKLPEWLKRGLVVIHIAIYTTIFTLESHNLYYDGITVETGGIFLRVLHGNGIVHHINMTIQVIYIVALLVMIGYRYRRESRGFASRRLLIFGLAVIVQAVFFIAQLIGIPGLTEYYDISMTGYFLGTIIMLIAILTCDLMGTSEIAREYVVDRISEGIIAVDLDGVVRYYNEPAARLYPKLKRGTSDVMNAIAEAVRNDEAINMDGRIYTPEVSDLVYRGESYGKLYALVDDTEHYRYMEELKEQREIADQANAAKSRFLANMSHEIRTPINAVLGMDEMILRESGEKNIRSYASDIMSAGKTLLSLINDILDLSKVEEGKMEIIPVQYELYSLVNDLINMTRERANRKGLKFDVLVDMEIPHLLIGDEIRIRQCAMNLLTNAVKYTEKGSVTLRVDYDGIEDDPDHIMLTFSVDDTGIGMKAEDMEKLFSPYKRIEEERNRTIEGTGLGMSITRHLLELMGSSLSVKSEYGRGSAFSFSLKQEVASHDAIGDYARELETQGKVIETEYHELFHAPDAHILVVDDTEMNLTVLQSLLKRTGIRIDTATSGREAVAKAETHPYDVILIDHMMPDMDGIETMKNIHLSGVNQSTPAVALTANAVSGAREMYLEAGFSDYLSKPVDGSRLERMLAALIPAEKILIPDPSEDDKQGSSKETCPEEHADTERGHDASGLTPADGGLIEDLLKSIEDLNEHQRMVEAEVERQSDRGRQLAREVMKLMETLTGRAYEGPSYGSAADAEEPADASDTVEGGLPGWLLNISDIDTAAGLSNCGSVEGYLSVLGVFHRTAADKADEIEQLRKNGDIDGYTIKVHALKSSARIIGAGELSKLAEQLEMAGKDHDTAGIDENTDRLLTLYRLLDMQLKALDTDGDELADIDPGALREAYQTIVEISGSMDYEMMDGMLKDLHGYRLPEADARRVAEIENLLSGLDWDGIIQVAKAALEA